MSNKNQIATSHFSYEVIAEKIQQELQKVDPTCGIDLNALITGRGEDQKGRDCVQLYAEYDYHGNLCFHEEEVLSSLNLRLIDTGAYGIGPTAVCSAIGEVSTMVFVAVVDDWI